MEPIEQKRPGKVLGTAGHIDHGKSALIRALTGTDPDRLAEEKQRGITIELGFAQLVLPDGSTLGVVDVPGHEKFVRQMISGSTGIDIALLCIAADDGVMPQTREHVAVLELLGVPTCVVALTKCDRVDDDMVELAREDVRDFLADTPYADAPIVATSSVTGQGLDELKDELLRASKRTTSDRAQGAPRMPVDRVFTIKGAGTVITGTLWSGSIAPEDELEILPQGRRVRVRSVQEHDRPVARAQAGNRVALNLPGISTDDIRPGDFLAAPGAIVPTDRFDCRFTYASPLAAGKPLETGTRIRVAHGTREVFGRLLLMDDAERLTQGESAFAQIRLDEPLPLSRGDRFIARSESPVAVIGGGQVLLCHPRRRTRLSDDERALLEGLRQGDDNAALDHALALAAVPQSAAAFARTFGIPQATCSQGLSQRAQKKLIRRFDGGAEGPLYASEKTARSTFDTIEQALLAFHAENPTELGIKKADLAARCGLRMDPRDFDVMLAAAIAAGTVLADDGVLSHPKAGANARKREQEQAERIASALAEAGATPPAADELCRTLDLPKTKLYRALGTLEQSGRIVRIDKSIAYDADALTDLRGKLEARLAHGVGATVAELRDALGVTRKYAVPLLEYFDRCGVTVRDGDVRTLGGDR